MSKPLWFREESVLAWRSQAEQVRTIIKNSNILFFAIALAMFAVIISLWNSQTTYYAHAFMGYAAQETKSVSPLFENSNELFASKNDLSLQSVQPFAQPGESIEKKIETPVAKLSAPDLKKATKQAGLLENLGDTSNNKAGILGLGVDSSGIELQKFAEKLYSMVGDTPIKQMVPFISARDEKVAAFLVGIAKKESSFGLASPSKDGETCYNYWGYKGEGGRGTGMGYACFASAEEAIRVVGDRIEVLVNKERNTPARMVDTWKCGRSCAGDPGAPGWTSTVAIYFNQIVNQKNQKDV